MKLFSTLLILSVLLALPAAPLFAGQAPAPYIIEMEDGLLEWINAARANPLEVAAQLGLGPQRVLSDLPELRDLLLNGMPPLQPEGSLAEAARSHTQDMLAANFYGYLSSSGKDPATRITEAGYAPLKSGEALGSVGFFNFIDPVKAVRQVFSTLYAAELDPARTRPRLILDPDFRDVGIGFGSGPYTAGQVTYNVYFVTCDFAAPSASTEELEILELINQAREAPLAMAAAVGLVPAAVSAALPELADLLEDGLPPLTFSAPLHTAARGHAADLIENGYYASVSPDGRSVEDRAAEKGYAAAQVAESIRLFSTVDAHLPRTAAWHCFRQLLRRELSPAATERNILNPALREVGTGLVSAPAAEAAANHATMLVCDFGAPLVPDPWPSLKGRVYDDRNADGLYSPGEGLQGLALHVVGPAFQNTTVYTNPAGGFALRLPPGADFQVTRSAPGAVETVRERMGWDGANQALDFVIEAAP